MAVCSELYHNRLSGLFIFKFTGGNGFSDKMSKMLETLGNMLRSVGTRINMNIPQIQSMVVIKGASLPGEGIDTFLPGYGDRFPDYRNR